MLEIRNLTKSYGDVLALDRFSLDLAKGEVLGLLGPNGAGKTTLISILAGTLGGFTGTVTFQGQSLFASRQLKNRLGIVPQDMAFYEDLSAMDNLLFWGGLYDVPRAELKRRAAEILELVELAGRAKEPVKKFSGGMKRRLNTAIGLLHKPDLLLLDEPTVGIDVQAKVSILDIIRNVGAAGTAVIFTTHQLAEVETACSRIAIMDKGRILAQGTLDELVRIVGERTFVEISGEFGAGAFSEAIQDMPAPSVELMSAGDNLALLAVSDTDQIPRVMDRLFGRKLAVTDLTIKSPSLETVFLKLTGRSLRD
ncbi:MAG TPA: ABC transporter ATP-binding protein [Vicinamibacterales bacterium]|nr:ABC transporter ATP-binding protein [Vicinamibacterales bacterium]HPW19405.1 ABC transporter ATP-binding protein [Vicinamibacterales bacterium]